MLGDRQCQFERVDGIEAEIAFAEQRRFGVDGLRLNALDVQAVDHQSSQFQLSRRLRGGCGSVRH